MFEALFKSAFSIIFDIEISQWTHIFRASMSSIISLKLSYFPAMDELDEDRKISWVIYEPF